MFCLDVSRGTHSDGDIKIKDRSCFIPIYLSDKVHYSKLANTCLQSSDTDVPSVASIDAALFLWHQSR